MNRDFARELTITAATAAGISEFAISISEFSEQQNGAATHLSKHQLLAHLRNSLVEEIELVYVGALNGIPEDAREYEKKMMALKNVMEAWVAIYPFHNFH